MAIRIQSPCSDAGIARVSDTVADADGTDGSVGVGVGDDGSVSGSKVAVAGTVSVAVGRGAVLVASGSAWATSSCSCMPRAMATTKVRATSTTAISPLQSGPNPPPRSPDPPCSCPSPDLRLIPPQHHVAKNDLWRRPLTDPSYRSELRPTWLAGRMNLNVVPTPFSLSTHSRPPWASTSSLTSARPAPDSPRPGGVRLGRV